jgi:hypothetical protein
MRVHSMIIAAMRGLALIAFVLIPTIGVSSQDKAEYKAKKHEAKMNKEFCSSDSWSSGDKVSFKELREMTIPASGLLDVDGGRNGGIKVKGEDRSDILVRACVQAWSTSDEAARALAGNIKISTSPAVKAENSAEESNWSVSYDIRVPRSTDLKLLAHNGGISIGGVEGTLEFETTNGGVHLSDVAGAVKGRTTNGGVNVMLSGNTWKGSGLDVTTSNGGVHLSMPETYAANIETGTVNGGFRSDIAALNIEGTEKTRNRRINTAINGGGAPIRVVTTNGGIKISSAERAANY